MESRHWMLEGVPQVVSAATWNPWLSGCRRWDNSTTEMASQFACTIICSRYPRGGRSHVWHTYQLLTKRADRLAEIAPALVWPRNVWMGVTVEDNERLSRVERLREVPSAVRFLSIEPLLAQLPALNLDGIDWVIVGGESGPGARPMHENWVLEIRDACLDGAVPFFFKQWGGTRKKAAGRELESRTWSEMPCRQVGVA